jgi:hypothetical protein
MKSKHFSHEAAKKMKMIQSGFALLRAIFLKHVTDLSFDWPHVLRRLHELPEYVMYENNGRSRTSKVQMQYSDGVTERVDLFWRGGRHLHHKLYGIERALDTQAVFTSHAFFDDGNDVLVHGASDLHAIWDAEHP